MITYDCRKKKTQDVIKEIKALNLDVKTEITIVYFNGNTQIKSIAKVLQDLRGLLSDERVMRF